MLDSFSRSLPARMARCDDSMKMKNTQSAAALLVKTWLHLFDWQGKQVHALLSAGALQLIATPTTEQNMTTNGGMSPCSDLPAASCWHHGPAQHSHQTPCHLVRHHTCVTANSNVCKAGVNRGSTHSTLEPNQTWLARGLLRTYIATHVSTCTVCWPHATVCLHGLRPPLHPPCSAGHQPRMLPATRPLAWLPPSR